MKRRTEESLRADRVMGKPPSRTEIGRNMAKLNGLLDIDPEDYGNIDPQEVKSRIQARITEQDEVIYPRRLEEDRLTPEWRRYISGRRSKEGN